MIGGSSEVIDMKRYEMRIYKCEKCGGTAEGEAEVGKYVPERFRLCQKCRKEKYRHARIKPVAEIKITDENRLFFDELFQDDE